MMSHEQKTGTKEWADTNVNCVRGIVLNVIEAKGV